MDYERWLLEDALDFEFVGRGYRFEPEFTLEELREMEARAMEAPEAPAEAVPPGSRAGGVPGGSAGRCRRKSKVGAARSGTLCGSLYAVVRYLKK